MIDTEEKINLPKKLKILIGIGIAIVVALIIWFVADEVMWIGHKVRDIYPSPPPLK